MENSHPFGRFLPNIVQKKEFFEELLTDRNYDGLIIKSGMTKREEADSFQIAKKEARYITELRT